MEGTGRTLGGASVERLPAEQRNNPRYNPRKEANEEPLGLSRIACSSAPALCLALTTEHSATADTGSLAPY